MMLTEVIRHQPKLIVGLGEGGLVAALASLPLALEAACRARVLTDQQMYTIRRSWSKGSWDYVHRSPDSTAGYLP